MNSGVAGPFVGLHHDALIVAGGANFPKPVWDNDKLWRDRIFVLTKVGNQYAWQTGGTLDHSIAYGASVSTPDGVVCIGGNDASQTFSDVFLLRWNAAEQSITQQPYPVLPKPCAYAAATLIGETIYVAGGQSDLYAQSAMSQLWSLDLSKRNDPTQFVWRELTPCPGPTRAYHLTGCPAQWLPRLRLRHQWSSPVGRGD